MSVHKRVVSAEGRHKLLACVLKKGGRGSEGWDKDQAYLDVWESEYECVVQSYAQKFRKYADEWMQSEAGKAYGTHVQSCR